MASPSRRRREAATLLRLVADLAAYGAREVSNGLTPTDARAAIGELAAELATASARLRRAARPGPAERRMMIRLLSAQGLTGAQVAARTGLSEKTIYRYRTGPTGPQRSPDAR